jgi:hypothetical protein
MKFTKALPFMISTMVMVMAVIGAMLIGIGSMRIADAANQTDWFVAVNATHLSDGTLTGLGEPLGTDEVIIQINPNVDTTTLVAIINAHNFVWPDTFGGKTVVEVRGNDRTMQARTVTLPQGLRVIGANAFRNMIHLESFTIPNTVSVIGHWAFANCTRLASVTIPTSVTTIGTSAFQNCPALVNFTIPNSVTTIHDSAFRDCVGLANLTIGTSVAIIGALAFWGNTSLTSVTIPDSVTSIGAEAFRNCTNLTSATIGANVINLGASMFLDTNLTSVTFPSNPVDIDARMFQGTNLTNITFQGSMEFRLEGSSIIRNSDNMLVLGTNNTIIPSGVRSIGPWAFMGRANISTIAIPANVTSIGANAFRDCTNLFNVTIGTGVTSIGAEAFRGATRLATIAIPNNVISIASSAFRDCTSLENISIGTGVTSIGFEAFRNTRYINERSDHLVYISNHLIAWNGIMSPGTSVNIAQTTLTIADFAFANRSQLASVIIPNSVTHIGTSAFQGCTGLTSVIIPNSVTHIGASAFQNCTNLASVTLGSSVTVIGQSAFLGCSSLNGIVIPQSVTTIGALAFQHCTSLTSITIPSNVASMGADIFQGCTNLATINSWRPESKTTSYAWQSNWNGSNANVVWHTFAVNFFPNGAVGQPQWVLVERGHGVVLPSLPSDRGFTFGDVYFRGWHTEHNATSGWLTTVTDIWEDVNIYSVFTSFPPADNTILVDEIGEVVSLRSNSQTMVNNNNSNKYWTDASWANFMTAWNDLGNALIIAQQFAVTATPDNAEVRQAHVNNAFNALSGVRLAYETAFDNLRELIAVRCTTCTEIIHYCICVYCEGCDNLDIHCNCPIPVCSICEDMEDCTCPPPPTAPNNMTFVHIGIALIVSALIAGMSTFLGVAFIRKKAKKTA